MASEPPPERATDIAVALRYAPRSPDVPRVVASGSGAVAGRIVELARAHGIAIRENADLAEMLRALAVDDQIPAAAFSIVAEILFHVLQADGRLSAPQGPVP